MKTLAHCCPRPLTLLTVASLLLFAGLASTPAAANSAQYTVRFEATWSEETHPQDFPGRPHFSPLVGGTHSADISFWQPGAVASAGMERMAELGDADRLANEMRNAGSLVDQVFIGPALESSPGAVSFDFEIDSDFPRVTLVTMIAPSPDWFVGVSGVSLLRQGEWVEELTVDLVAWDAGTDSGPTYRSPDADTQPARPISQITDGPLGPGNGAPYLGRFVFTRTDVAPPPPPLLLRGDRFSITARWQRPDGTAGSGHAQGLSDDTGSFWFFDRNNVELIVKVLDACSRPQPRFWFFAGGLTNVGVELTVTDTETGATKTYQNTTGAPFAPIQDTRAFATCTP